MISGMISGYSFANCSRMVKENAFTAAFSCTSQINEKQASITSPFNASGIETYCNSLVIFLRTALCKPGFRNSETNIGKCFFSNCGCISAIDPMGHAALCTTRYSSVRNNFTSSSNRFCELPIQSMILLVCSLECLASISARRFNCLSKRLKRGKSKKVKKKVKSKELRGFLQFV